MSPLDRLKSVKGEAHQGNYLINAKERHSEKKNHHHASAHLQRKTIASSHGVQYSVSNQTAASRHHYANTYSATKATHEREQ